MQSFDWSHLQSFLAVVDQGSLSGAARALVSSQPTVGRHVHALEERLGVRLFTRTARGLELTETGMALLVHARHMEEAAGHLGMAAEGSASAISGAVRLTASEVIATYVLPGMLTEFHREEPEVEIELVASNRTENLLRREADIAVRMFRPTQADVFTRKVADLDIGVYAAPSYLDRRGEPSVLTDLLDHDVIGYDRDDLMIRGFRAAGAEVDRSFFAFRCDDQVVCWRMTVAGYGIGFNQVAIGTAEPGVRRILPDAKLPTMPVWLAAHAELKTSLRVRRVFDFLAEKFAIHAAAQTRGVGRGAAFG